MERMPDLPDDSGVDVLDDPWLSEPDADAVADACSAAFGDAGSDANESLPDGYADRLGLFLSDVEQDEAELAMHAGRRARSIEQARAWAMVSDEFVRRDARLSDAQRQDWVMRVFVSEVATRLRIPRPTAEHLIAESRSLVHELPGTLEALESAAISYRHAQVLIDQARTLPASARAAFEEALLPDAQRMPAARFRALAARTREKMHPTSIVQRTREARADRRLVFEADADGMAWLHHRAPVAQAMAAFNRVTRVARSLQVDGEKRTLSQLRSDVATDLLLNGVTDRDPGDVGGSRGDAEVADAVGGETAGDRKKRAWGIRPTVFVTVPVLTLLGHGEEPGYLAGYGPIDADTARELAARAPSFIRLLTHPETGVVLSMGRKKYKVPKDLRRWLQLRDETCRGVGCGRPAADCDIDHTEDWARDGLTDPNNLAHLCKGCHQLKHVTTWRVAQGEGGVLEWRSPTGRVHETRPAMDLPESSAPGGGASGGSASGDREPPPF